MKTFKISKFYENDIVLNITKDGNDYITEFKLLEKEEIGASELWDIVNSNYEDLYCGDKLEILERLDCRPSDVVDEIIEDTDHMDMCQAIADYYDVHYDNVEHVYNTDYLVTKGYKDIEMDKVYNLKFIELIPDISIDDWQQLLSIHTLYTSEVSPLYATSSIINLLESIIGYMEK